MYREPNEILCDLIIIFCVTTKISSVTIYIHYFWYKMFKGLSLQDTFLSWVIMLWHGFSSFAESTYIHPVPLHR